MNNVGENENLAIQLANCLTTTDIQWPNWCKITLMKTLPDKGVIIRCVTTDQKVVGSTPAERTKNLLSSKHST